MRFLVDINVVLDVVLEREPWLLESARLLSAIDAGRAEGWVAGHTVTTVHYVARANRGGAAAVAAVADVLRVMRVSAPEAIDFQEALAADLDDFEDAVQAVCARKIGADYVVTRDERGFRGAGVRPLSPGEALAMVEAGAS